jgi:hypothetical protein
MHPKKPKTKVVYTKLGREKAWGQAHLGENTIEIDVRVKGYRHLLYGIHEYLHILHPEWSETRVQKESSKIAQFVWHLNYRRVEK